MKKLAIAMLLMSTPVMADIVSVGGGPASPQQAAGVPLPQTGGGAPQANTVGEPIINGNICYPIGRTDKGDLVYSMDCQNVPLNNSANGGALSGSGESGFSNSKLQNSNPTGLPPSQTSGAPTGSSGNTPPSGYSNVTPEKK
jgi:hypothetical protein